MRPSRNRALAALGEKTKQDPELAAESLPQAGGRSTRLATSPLAAELPRKVSRSCLREAGERPRLGSERSVPP